MPIIKEGESSKPKLRTRMVKHGETYKRGMNDVLGFGKYRHLKVNEVLILDPEYLCHIHENTRGGSHTISFSERVLDELYKD